ncbi:MAG: hypothetical protein K2L94_03270 [Alphaproteobacteria bacterium]|nr:hypothetical protein [Alphaproteobacteria bacterium]
MKKFNRTVHKTMGSLPPQLRKYIQPGNIRAATGEFHELMNRIATDFHTQLDAGVAPAQIVPMAGHLFGMPVKLDYVASGSVGSVYKMQIGDDVFAFKINRQSAFGELDVLPRQGRARNLVNKMYLGAVFEHGGRKYSWVLSDYVPDDSVDSFYNAMEKLYYAYLTKGVDIRDAHPNNFKNGKLIDPASFARRDGKIDDIKKLTRTEIDIVKKMVHCIRTDDVEKFSDWVSKCVIKYPAVINYMFLGMKFGKSPVFGVGSNAPFAIKLKPFETIINSAHAQVRQNNILWMTGARVK